MRKLIHRTHRSSSAPGTKPPLRGYRPFGSIAGLVLVSLAAVVGIAVVAFSMAAGPAATYLVPSGTLGSGATIANNGSAIGGRMVVFGPAATPAPTPTPTATPTAAPTPTPTGSCAFPKFPDASCTGVPAGVTLHGCPTTITTTGTYDACLFSGDVSIRANNVHITRSQINGAVDAGSGNAGDQSGLVISDSTLNCGCQSVGATDTPSAIMEANYTLLRDNIYNSGHGAAVRVNVTVQDSYIHGLGGNTDAHKDGIFSGGGNNVTIKHNNIECNDGPKAGCTAAIGLLSDFEPETNYTIDSNLFNTNGSYCVYGSGGPSKTYSPQGNHIVVTNNHFGRKDNAQCGFYGPVTYFYSQNTGNIWSGNVWDDTGATVPAAF